MSNSDDEPEDLAMAAMRLGQELTESATEAFATFCESHELDPPTKREKIMIKVMALQLASSIATALEDRQEEH